MQGSLPAGWLAFAGRELNPLDHDKRFQITFSFPSSGFILAQRPKTCTEADNNPPTSRASLLLWHDYARIVSPRGSVQLGGVNLLALCPLDKVGRAIRWISAPPLEHAGVDRLVDVDVASVFPNIRFSADGAIKRRRNLGVQS